MSTCIETIKKIYQQPFIDLILQAQTTLRTHFKANSIQLSTLLNIKMGSCPENCGYCSQSVHYSSNIEAYKLLSKSDILEKAKAAKLNGATRFCLAAAWRGPTHSQIDVLSQVITEIKQLGLDTCVSLGLLKTGQAEKLKSSGLDYYNHNLNTSKGHYKNIATSHTFEDRLATIKQVQDADINLCCGGILGMGENEEERLNMLYTLTQLPVPPKSVSINILTPMPGTPLEHQPKINILESVRLIATARILFPTSFVRLSGGRDKLNQTEQALCYLAGINSIHFGSDYLLTEYTALPTAEADLTFLNLLGITPLSEKAILSEPA
jgi:biotin synthase